MVRLGQLVINHIIWVAQLLILTNKTNQQTNHRQSSLAGTPVQSQATLCMWVWMPAQQRAAASAQPVRSSHFGRLSTEGRPAVSGAVGLAASPCNQREQSTTGRHIIRAPTHHELSVLSGKVAAWTAAAHKLLHARHGAAHGVLTGWKLPRPTLTASHTLPVWFHAHVDVISASLRLREVLACSGGALGSHKGSVLICMSHPGLVNLLGHPKPVKGSQNRGGGDGCVTQELLTVSM